MNDTRQLTDDELARMREQLDRELEDRKTTRTDEPRSYADRNGHGRLRPTEIQGVLFQLRVAIGRRGETMPAYVLFPPVRDERELETLAEQVAAEFRGATIYQPKSEYRGGYGGRDRGGYGRDRGDHDRDREYRRY